MTVQTSYDIDHSAAYSGLPANENGLDVKSMVANAVILPGRVVVRHAATDVCRPPGAADEAVMGVAIRTLEHQVGSTQVLQYEDEEMVAIAEAGEIWVIVEDAVVIGGAAFYRHTTSDFGLFRSDVDGGDAEALTGAYYTSAAGAGELARLSRPRQRRPVD